MKPYWFKPKRFWGWFAAYYPVSFEGWVVTLAFLSYVVWQFMVANDNSHSVSDVLIMFTIRSSIAFIVFDIITRMFGEYPSWWRGARLRRVKWFKK